MIQHHHQWDVWTPIRDYYDPRGVYMDGVQPYRYKCECMIMGCSAVRWAENVEPTGVTKIEP